MHALMHEGELTIHTGYMHSFCSWRPSCFIEGELPHGKKTYITNYVITNRFNEASGTCNFLFKWQLLQHNNDQKATMGESSKLGCYSKFVFSSCCLEVLSTSLLHSLLADERMQNGVQTSQPVHMTPTQSSHQVILFWSLANDYKLLMHVKCLIYPCFFHLQQVTAAPAKDYLGLSILTLLCFCCPLGVMALIKSAEVCL